MSPPLIKAFDFTEMHEVVGFGRILWPKKITSEFRIEVVFAKVVDRKTYSLGLDPVTRSIGCGQLDLVPIGSRWIQERSVGQRVYTRRIVGNVAWRRTGTLGEFLPQPEPFGLALATDMPCYLMLLSSADLKFKWVVVPVAEVVRLLFGISSHFLVQLIGGVRNPRFAPDSAFYDRGLSHRIAPTAGQDPDHRGFHLACTRRPTDMEAILAAWMLDDEGLRWPHDSVCQARVVGADDVGDGPFTMAFPKPTETSPWTFEGRYIPSAATDTTVAGDPARTGAGAFLVTRILEMPVTPTFQTLTIAMHALKGTKGGLPTKKRIVVLPGTPIPRMGDDRRPGTGRAAIEVTTDGADLEPAHEIEIIRLEGTAGGKPPPLKLVGGRNDVTDGSTGDRGPGGDDSTGHVVFRRRRQALLDAPSDDHERARSREATYVAVAEIAHVHGWPILHGGRGVEGNVHLESVPVRRTSFDLLVVCVRTPLGDAFVADAGTEARDARSIGLLMRSARTAFDADADLAAIIHHSALTGARWRSSTRLHGFDVVGLSRQPSGIWSKTAAYYDLILEGLADLLR